MKKVAVLLATYNGFDYLSEQIYSILNQEIFTPTIFISDDGSNDGTLKILMDLKCNNIKIIDNYFPLKSPACNFINLIVSSNLDSYDFIFFSDQDDIWMPNKILSAIDILNTNEFDCYASNLSVFKNGKVISTIKKSYDQTRNDFLFQSASAGCTYCLNRAAFYKLKEVLCKHELSSFINISHDWLIYAVTRSNNYRWFIDHNSYILYRQHNSNVWSKGFFSNLLIKIDLIKSGWYKKSVFKISSFCLLSHEQTLILSLISNMNIVNKFKLIKYFHTFRRNFFESVLLGLLIIFGFF